jgi:hypothetical protein
VQASGKYVLNSTLEIRIIVFPPPPYNWTIIRSLWLHHHCYRFVLNISHQQDNNIICILVHSGPYNWTIVESGVKHHNPPLFLFHTQYASQHVNNKYTTYKRYIFGIGKNILARLRMRSTYTTYWVLCILYNSRNILLCISLITATKYELIYI